MNTILIVDDEKNVLSSFKKILVQDGYEVFTANDGEEALSIAADRGPNLVVMDIKMPRMTGLEALAKFKKIDPKVPVIIMTAFGTIDTAIEAMKLGAYDYVVKPFDIPAMKGLIKKTLEASRLMKVNVSYEPKEAFKGDRIVGFSTKMQQLYKLIGQVSASDVTVLLKGESGTGKELIARAIYHHSARKDKPFLVINSAAIPDALLESELFGYEKGAFTDARERRVGKLEQCDGGTIFLDEIGDMSSSTQAKVLRVLENKSFEKLGGDKTIKVNVRILAATNKNLEALVKEGKFREDLYYRLSAMIIDIPPLRERGEDIPDLAKYFLSKYAKELNKDTRKISSEALQLLQDYDWPGNVRELENVVKKSVLLSAGSVLLPEHIAVTKGAVSKGGDLKKELQELLSSFIKQKMDLKTKSLYSDIISQAERTLIIEVLKQTQGNQSLAAKLLGISRPTLKDKIGKLNIKTDVNIKEDQKL